jgi:hypothetical protein
MLMRHGSAEEAGHNSYDVNAISVSTDMLSVAYPEDEDT